MFFKIILYLILILPVYIHGMDDSIEKNGITCDGVVISYECLPYINTLNEYVQKSGQKVVSLEKFNSNCDFSILATLMYVLNEAILLIRSREPRVLSTAEQAIICNLIDAQQYEIIDFMKMLYVCNYLDIAILKDGFDYCLEKKFLALCNEGKREEIEAFILLLSGEIEQNLIELLLKHNIEKLWQLFGSQVKRKVINLHSDSTRYVYVTPNSWRAVTVGYGTSVFNHKVTIVDVSTMNRIDFDVTGDVQDVVINNASIAILLNDKQVQIFDIVTGKLRQEYCAQDVDAVEFTKIQLDENYLAIFYDTTVCLIDLVTQQKTILHSDKMKPIQVYITNDQQTVIIYYDESRCVEIFARESRELMGTLDGISSALVSLDGKSLIVSDNRDISVVNIASLTTTKLIKSNKYQGRLIKMVTPSTILLSNIDEAFTYGVASTMFWSDSSDHGHLISIVDGSSVSLMDNIVDRCEHALLSNTWVFDSQENKLILFNPYTHKKITVFPKFGGCKTIRISNDKKKLLCIQRSSLSQFLTILDINDKVSQVSLQQLVIQLFKPETAENTCVIS